jgi:hypothetical protein
LDPSIHRRWHLAFHLVTGALRPPVVTLAEGTKCEEMQAPKVTTWRGVIWPKDSLLPGRRGREQRAKRERERGAGA